MKAEYVQHWGDDLIVANSARVSFDKQSEWEEKVVAVAGWFRTEKVLSDRDKKLVHFLAREGHTSTFEHMGATLRLKVPIFIARQIQRHRTFSYNEVSRRYVDDEPEFFWPDKWRKRADNVKQGSSDEEFPERFFDGYQIVTTQEVLQQHVNYTVGLYKELLTNGMAPEQARMILPQNMYTSFYMSGNLRAWGHFLSLRLDGHAQKEIQDIAVQVKNILTPLWPVSLEALMEQ